MKLSPTRRLTSGLHHQRLRGWGNYRREDLRYRSRLRRLSESLGRLSNRARIPGVVSLDRGIAPYTTQKPLHTYSDSWGRNTRHQHILRPPRKLHRHNSRRHMRFASRRTPTYRPRRSTHSSVRSRMSRRMCRAPTHTTPVWPLRLGTRPRYTTCRSDSLPLRRDCFPVPCRTGFAPHRMPFCRPRNANRKQVLFHRSRGIFGARNCTTEQVSR